MSKRVHRSNVVLPQARMNTLHLPTGCDYWLYTEYVLTVYRRSKVGDSNPEMVLEGYSITQ